MKNHLEMTKSSVFNFLTASLLCVAIFTSCKKDSGPSSFPTSSLDANFFALTSNNQLLRINAKTGSTPLATYNISGLPSGTKIISIDFRPATGQLYGLGSDSRLYTINIDNGNATAIGSGSFSPALSGSIASIDFNPTVDRIRLVTNAGQNLRLNPETGGVAAVDGAISNASITPGVVGIAYTNNKAGAATTTLYDIGVNAKKLYIQNPPNDGVLQEISVNAFDIPFEGQVGFDINADNSLVLAAFTAPTIGFSKLFSIDLNTGRSYFIVDLPTVIIDIAIPTTPVAYAVSESNTLLIFDPTQPQTSVTKNITGLAAGENILGIDFRPANGQLYALGSSNRLYTINTSSGAATAVGAGFGATTLSGTSFGFDFNPTVDRIRVVSNTGQNLRLNPNDGTVAATDGVLNGGAIGASAAAYTNNFAGATSTTLYVMDASRLYTQNPPNNGTLVNVGSLGITVDANNGFDIGSRSGIAYAILTVGSSTKLFSINLSSGAATAIADMPNKVRGFAIGLGF